MHDTALIIFKISITALVENTPETPANISKLLELTKLSQFRFCAEKLDHFAADLKVS